MLTTLKCKKRLLVLSLILLNLPQSGFPQSQAMEAGISAFNNQNYTEALRQFQMAEAQGLESDSLRYNLAVTLYSLERYEEAKASFLPLMSDPAWTPLINYNFGLIAEAQGDRQEALRYYSLSAEQEEVPKISTAAEEKLSRLQQSPQTSSTRSKTAALVSAALGSDSNASSLSDEFVQSRSDAEDVYSEVLGYVQHYAQGNYRDGIKLYGLLFSRQLQDFDNLDSLVYGGGASLEKPLWGLNTETGLRLTQIRLDSDKVADQFQLKLAASRPTGLGTFSSGYFYSNYDAGSRFEQVDGNRHRVDLGWEKTFTPIAVSLRYRYENNDREGLSRNGAYSSYSPVRNGMLAEVEWQLTTQWSTGLSYEVIDSDYKGVNRLRDSDGTVKQMGRKNTLDRLTLDLSYRLSSHWRLRGKVERTEVDDVYDIYTYDKNRILGTVEYQF